MTRDLPFDGAISRYFDTEFPDELRERVRKAEKNDVLAGTYPYAERMDGGAYDKARDALQIELVKLQAWVKAKGERVAVVFEGRDAAGKGGAIKRFREHLNPRGARVVALSKPSDAEAGQWYFQRYIAHLPTYGEIVFFDRSWYNRAVVEWVFGFCTKDERDLFFRQVSEFERMLVADGIRLFKVWLTVSRAEQMRRMLSREKDPLKQWKLSTIDVEGLAKWEAYSKAIDETFVFTNTAEAPWSVVRADDKRRARLATQRIVLSAIDYAGRSEKVVTKPDPAIVGGPEILPTGDG
ncbi:polyphosphate kinase 2 [Acuticoccus mangrovi]|uniref:ADP/GDP-polyphosphate phosphotransferase n=1 Tax=Acuticoccus mangrovi TaxID=2796142 RepID=A0A934MCM6_9HYPH|nr:polyphosphate kinase 2 [Acuticoccus mangrovi]MBJ3775437.1 polyphosphate kinase 2 [Acuticoccus mangrovi]